MTISYNKYIPKVSNFTKRSIKSVVCAILLIVSVVFLIWSIYKQNTELTIAAGILTFAFGSYCMYDFMKRKDIRFGVRQYVSRYDPKLKDKFKKLLANIKGIKIGGQEDRDILDDVSDFVGPAAEAVGNGVSAVFDFIGEGIMAATTAFIGWAAASKTEQQPDPPHQIKAKQPVKDPSEFNKYDEWLDSIDITPLEKKETTSQSVALEHKQMGYYSPTRKVEDVDIDVDSLPMPLTQLFHMISDINDDPNLEGDVDLVYNYAFMYVFPFKLKNVSEPYREYFIDPKASYKNIITELYKNSNYEENEDIRTLNLLTKIIEGEGETKYGEIKTQDDINACIHLILIDKYDIKLDFYKFSNKQQSIIMNQILDEMKSNDMSRMVPNEDDEIVVNPESDLSMLRCYKDAIACTFKYILMNAIKKHKQEMSDEEARKSSSTIETETKFIESVKLTVRSRDHLVLDNLHNVYYSGHSNSYSSDFMEQITNSCKRLLLRYGGIIKYLAYADVNGYDALYGAIKDYLNQLNKHKNVKYSLERFKFVGSMTRLFEKSIDISTIWPSYIHVEDAEEINDILNNPSTYNLAKLYFKSEMNELAQPDYSDIWA